MQEPIVTLFSSESTKVETTIQEEEDDNDNVMVSFDDLQSDHDEEDIPDELIMSIADATTRLIENLTTFKKEYLNDLHVKVEKDEIVFLKTPFKNGFEC
ncbi:unnamed protein product [Lactuca saligna]|uniref:Uncharacterized protein n=1 Tax=Lactuca saligna TaxID=75948 RepID=A0AA35ZVY1_LACSI|nr:unnamed protein product [Lactuca saligna]